MKYEYRTIRLNVDADTNSITAQLIAVGDDGWELVNVLENGVAIFKKPELTLNQPSYVYHHYPSQYPYYTVSPPYYTTTQPYYQPGYATSGYAQTVGNMEGITVANDSGASVNITATGINFSPNSITPQ